MSVAWPSSQLPLPTLQGYALALTDETVQTQFESGPLRIRRRFSAGPVAISARWVMSADQVAILESWFSFTAQSGAEWITGLEAYNGLGPYTTEHRFIGPPILRPIHGWLWEVTATLQARTRNLLTAEELEAVIAYGPDDLYASSDTLHILVHTSLPGALIW